MSEKMPNGNAAESLKQEVALLNIRLKHLQNDFYVTKAENEQTTVHYLETLSELQRKHSELEKLKNNLEIMVEKRTHELNESQQHLLMVQRMETIGALAGGIAHDFNNILFAVIGYTEMAIDDAQGNHMVEDNLNSVLKSCHRAKELVRHILNFSRQEKADPRPMAICPILKESVKMLRAILPSTIDVRFYTPSEDFTVMADPTEVHQILVNLCTNAADSMPEKSGIIEISVDRLLPTEDVFSKNPRLAPGDYVSIAIADTGSGIDPAILGQIFHPFFTTKPKGKGTGLGLSIVNDIVTRYNGLLQVESRTGQGSTFRIFLPELKEHEKTTQEMPRPIPRGKENILFVDDEVVLADLAMQMLSGLGYNIEVTTSSRNALEIIRKNPARFDLVIADQTMPEMTGVQLAQEILAIRPDMPIMLCSGYSELVSPSDISGLGIRAFHFKPLLKQELAESIRKVLDRK